MDQPLKQAVILAGGLGTRMRPLTDDRPKPMILIHGKPFLEYLLEEVKKNGITDVVLLLGYLPNVIMDYFGNGSKFGLNIKYSVGAAEDETGTRLRNAKDMIEEVFLLLYCDNFWRFPLKKLQEFHSSHPSLATVTVYTNRFGSTKNNTRVGQDGYVEVYDKSRTAEGLNGVEAGFFIMHKGVFDFMPAEDFSLEKIIFPELIARKQMSAFFTEEKYQSLGSIERLPQVEKYFGPQKVVFLDRDGVINKKAPKADYVKKWEEFEFLPGVLEGIRLLRENGYEIYIISNQSGIARGMMTKEDLDEIHRNMLKAIEDAGGKIDGIYTCLHGWNDNCPCRKPKPGMFFEAELEHSIDLSRAVFIGDDERDAEAGRAAGLKETILISPKENFEEIIRTRILKS